MNKFSKLSAFNGTHFFEWLLLLHFFYLNLFCCTLFSVQSHTSAFQGFFSPASSCNQNTPCLPFKSRMTNCNSFIPICFFHTLKALGLIYYSVQALVPIQLKTLGINTGIKQHPCVLCLAGCRQQKGEHFLFGQCFLYLHNSDIKNDPNSFMK